jgi:hypothetical protein
MPAQPDTRKRVAIFLNLERQEEAALFDRLRCEPAMAARSALLKQLAIRGLMLTQLANDPDSFAALMSLCAGQAVSMPITEVKRPDAVTKTTGKPAPSQPTRVAIDSQPVAARAVKPMGDFLSG